MTNTINIRSFKKSRLVERLMKTDRRRCHDLYLVSCYFSIDSARILINELNNAIYLNEAIIYIDRKAAIAIGKEDLQRFCNSFRNARVRLYAVDTNSLFHSKAYGLISYDNNNDIYCGSLVIGSANLTGQGLIHKNGNIETILDTQDYNLLFQFIEQIDTLSLLSIEDIDKFKNSEEFNFKYALLQEGAFIHKWLEDIGRYLSVRYLLNERGKQRIGDNIFREAGFNVETATISKRYFEFDYEPPHLEGTQNLIKNYGIETYLGHWLPLQALENMSEKKEFNKFCLELKNQLDSKMDSIKQSIADDIDYLKSQNIIQMPDSSPIELFENKVNELLNNELKLKRIFTRYEIFYLPYDIKQKNEIEELFDEMVELSEFRTRKNVTMKAFLDSIATTSLKKFKTVINESI